MRKPHLSARVHRGVVDVVAHGSAGTGACAHAGRSDVISRGGVEPLDGGDVVERGRRVPELMDFVFDDDVHSRVRPRRRGRCADGRKAGEDPGVALVPKRDETASGVVRGCADAAQRTAGRQTSRRGGGLGAQGHVGVLDVHVASASRGVRRGGRSRPRAAACSAEVAVCGEIGVGRLRRVTDQIEASAGDFRAVGQGDEASTSFASAVEGVRVGGRSVLKLRLSGRSSSQRRSQRKEEQKREKHGLSHEEPS